ncbi:MAG: hypothetical protein K2J63_13440, partial [Muribaculaceae bacterium]|nr:hypothetical protein [Muribaculaceae bacterium]
DFEEGRYKSDMLKLGAGIRVIPWFKDDRSLFLEVGSTYNMVMKCKTPYGKDKNQFKDGASTDFAVGYIWKRDTSNTTLSLGTNLNLYNYFNKEYSNDGGFYYPFANTKSTSLSVYVRIATFFTDW